MLRIFLGTCEAVRAMHTYHTGPTASASTLSSTASEPTPYPPPLAGRNAAAAGSSTDRDDDEDEEEEGEDLIVNRGDSEQSALIGGLGSDARQTELLEEEGETGMPGIGSDGEGIVLGKLNGNAAGQGNGREGSKKRELQPWAHRDIKPVSAETREWSSRTCDPDAFSPCAGKRHALRRRRDSNSYGFWLGPPRSHSHPDTSSGAHASRPRSGTLLNAIPRAGIV